MSNGNQNNDIVLPHLCSDFFLWMCYLSQRDESIFEFELPGSDGTMPVAFWIDDRIAFRSPASEQTRAVVTGDTVFQSQEVYAALVSGKVIQELRLFLRVYEREYVMTLRAPYLDVSGLKFPEHEQDGETALVLERMIFYNEVMMALQALYQYYGQLRLSKDWYGLLKEIRLWVHGDLDS